MSGRSTSRPAAMVVAVLALLLASVASPAQAALGAGVWVEGGSPATLERGDSIELSWLTTDAETVEGWVHQDLQRVDVPGWSGPLATGGMHAATVTVDLPPGRYFFVVEAGDGEQRAVSSVAVDVLPADEQTTDDEPPAMVEPPLGAVDRPAVPGVADPRIGVSPSVSGRSQSSPRIPHRAPRAGLG